MKTKSHTILSIFDTFKTKNDELTGEANRQRAIIAILAGNTNAAERTRTGISQKIAKNHGIVWKNIYSGIFRDLDEVLIPMGIVEEHGRLPLRRGPKALQEKGIPFYHLTKKGILIALSTSEAKNGEKLLTDFFSLADPEELEYEKILSSLHKISPSFVHSIFQKYVKAFCNSTIELLPLDLSRLKENSDNSLLIQKELLEGFLKLSDQNKQNVIKFLDKIA